MKYVLFLMCKLKNEDVFTCIYKNEKHVVFHIMLLFFEFYIIFVVS